MKPSTPDANAASEAVSASIGDTAERFGLATHVLRHWESVGLLTPARHGDHRRYGQQDLERIAVILIAKDAGLELGQIREMLSAGEPMGQSDLLREHVAELARRIAQAKAAMELIGHALECPHSFDACPQARTAVAARIPPARTRRGKIAPRNP